MKIKLLSIVLLCSFIDTYAQSISGRIVDAENHPLEFVNIALFQLPDSVLLTGCVSNDKGEFKIEDQDYTNTYLRISFIGYETLYILTRAHQVITLNELTVNLGEVLITANQKIYKLQNGVMKANVKNTILESLPTALDIIEQLPFVNSNEGDLIILGKGKPVIYINNRQVRDEKELQQLSSKDIKDIQIITQPGAHYDATVKSVIKITTEKAVGEGLSGLLYIKEGYSNVFLGNEYMTLNYRKKGLDIFGSFDYIHDKYTSSFISSQYIKTSMLQSKQVAKEKENGKTLTINPIVGVNYTPNKKVSTGVRYKYENLKYTGSAFNNIEDIKLNDSEWINQNTNITKNPVIHQANGYYSAALSEKLSLDINSDYLNGKDEIRQDSYIEEVPGNPINNINTRNYYLFASKGIVSIKSTKGLLSLGGEYSHTNVVQKYSINKSGLGIENTNDKLKQNRIALFSFYQLSLKNYTIKAGLRGENVKFNYYKNEEISKDQSKEYWELFPDISISYSNDDYQWMLGYERKINYPAYEQLRSNIQYSSPFVYESGNPNLLPKIYNSFTGLFAWKDIQVTAGYNHNKNDIQSLFLQYEDQPIILIKNENIPESKDISLGISYAPVIRNWKPRFELSSTKQWLNINETEEKFTKPILIAKWNNTLELSKTWILYMNTSFRSAGHNGIFYMKPSWGVNLRLSKQLLNKRLKILLAANDIFKTNNVEWDMKYNNIGMQYDKTINSRLIYVVLTYRFNSTSKKYKGQPASDEINRL